MFKTLTAKALLGVGALALVGGGTALATAPVATSLTAAAKAPATAAARHAAGGVVQASTATSLTIQRRHRAAPGAAPTSEDLTFVLTPETRIFRWNDRKAKLGTSALKAGERVRVRYLEKDGQKVASAVEILPDTRAGTVTEKHPGGFTIKTAKGHLVHVAVTDTTKWAEGRRGKTSGSIDGLKVGDRAAVSGTASGPDGFDAARVRYWVPAAKPPARPLSAPQPPQ